MVAFIRFAWWLSSLERHIDSLVYGREVGQVFNENQVIDFVAIYVVAQGYL